MNETPEKRDGVEYYICPYCGRRHIVYIEPKSGERWRYECRCKQAERLISKV